MLTALDAGFGTGGFAHFHPGAAGSAVSANGLAVESDDTILQAGVAVDPATQKPAIALVHYNTNGSLDGNFGTGGVVLTPLSTGAQTPIVSQLLVDPQGRILLAGGDGTNFELLRYQSNGQLDNTFGNAGIVSTPIPGSHAQGTAERVAVDPMGDIVLAGGATSDERGAFAAIFRYTDNGTIDPTFGSGGLAVATGPGTKLSDVSSMAALADGGVVVGGTQTGGTAWALLRLTSAGRLDGGFGAGGVVTTDFGGKPGETAYGITQQEDLKLIVAGSAAGSGPNGFDLARYNPDGSLDTTFGAGGKLTTLFPGASVTHPSVIIDADQKILVGGGLTQTGQSGGYFALARYMADGSLDSAFGSGGLISTFGQAQTDENPSAVAVALDVDNNIVLGSSGADFNVARYVGDPQVPTFPAIFVAQQSIAAPTSGTQSMVFDVILSAPAAQTITVNYATLDGTAHAGTNYTAVSGVLSFAPGTTEKAVTVPILAQTTPAPNTSFALRLTGAVGAPIENNQVSGLILSNQPLPQIAVNDSSVPAATNSSANLVFTVMLSSAQTAPVTVTYQAVGDTAKSGVDFSPQTGTVTFAPGSTSQPVTVAVKPNLYLEPDERLFVELASPTGAALATAQGFGTIQNGNITAASWTNPAFNLDVNGDGNITPLDALLIINVLNTTGPELLPAAPAGVHFFYDVTGDKAVTPQDAILVINFLNAPQGTAAVAQGLAHSQPATSPATSSSVPPMIALVQATNLPGAESRSATIGPATVAPAASTVVRPSDVRVIEQAWTTGADAEDWLDDLRSR